MSQTSRSSDSSVYANRDIEKLLRSGEKGKLYRDEVYSLKKQITLYHKRIEVKDSTIELLTNQFEEQRKISLSYKSKFDLQKDYSTELEKTYLDYQKKTQKDIKKLQKQKTTKALGGTIVGVAAGIIIGLIIN